MDSPSPAAGGIVTIPLEEPILLGDRQIAEIQIRRPNSGELRGLSLAGLGQLNVDEIFKLLPRITIPTLPAPVLATIDPADMMEIADKVTDFLLSKRRKAELPTT